MGAYQGKNGTWSGAKLADLMTRAIAGKHVSKMADSLDDDHNNLSLNQREARISASKPLSTAAMNQADLSQLCWSDIVLYP